MSENTRTRSRLKRGAREAHPEAAMGAPCRTTCRADWEALSETACRTSCGALCEAIQQTMSSAHPQAIARAFPVILQRARQTVPRARS